MGTTIQDAKVPCVKWHGMSVEPTRTLPYTSNHLWIIYNTCYNVDATQSVVSSANNDKQAVYSCSGQMNSFRNTSICSQFHPQMWKP